MGFADLIICLSFVAHARGPAHTNTQALFGLKLQLCHVNTASEKQDLERLTFSFLPRRQLGTRGANVPPRQHGVMQSSQASAENPNFQDFVPF